jgi:hypothetical protein
LIVAGRSNQSRKGMPRRQVPLRTPAHSLRRIHFDSCKISGYVKVKAPFQSSKMKAGEELEPVK